MIASSLRAGRRTVVGRTMDHAFVEGDLEAVDQFVARVPRRAHESADPERRRTRRARSSVWRICSPTS